MAYKDKDKMKQAARRRQQRRRDKIKAKGVTGRDESEGVTQGVTRLDELDGYVPSYDNLPEAVLTPKGLVDYDKLPVDYGQPNCQCRHCHNNRASGSKSVLNHGPYKTFDQLAENEINRVSLPGDPDYDGVCLDSKYDSRRIPQTQQLTV